MPDQPRHNDIVNSTALPNPALAVLTRRGDVAGYRRGVVPAIAVVVALASALVFAAVEGDRAWRAGAVAAALAVLGVPLAVVGYRACQPRQDRRLDARAIRRRARIVLPVAAVVLATAVAGVAVKPALLGILAVVAGLYAVIVGGWYALYGLVHLRRVLQRAGRPARRHRPNRVVRPMTRWAAMLVTDGRNFAAGFLVGWLLFLAIVVGQTVVGGTSVQAIWLAAGIVSLAAAVFVLLAVAKRHMEWLGDVPDDDGWPVEICLHTAGTETHPCGAGDEDPGPSGPVIAFPVTSQDR